AELDPGGRERLKRAHQRAREVRGLVDEAGLDRSFAERARNAAGDAVIAIGCDREEAREVIARGLDRILEDIEAVALPCAPARDGRDRRVLRFRDLRGRAGRVERDLRLYPAAAQEVLDLRQR